MPRTEIPASLRDLFAIWPTFSPADQYRAYALTEVPAGVQLAAFEEAKAAAGDARMHSSAYNAAFAFYVWLKRFIATQQDFDRKGILADLREKFAPEAPELTVVPANPAAALVAQFRNIEQRARRLGMSTIGDTAHNWGNSLIASGVVWVALYQGYADQLEEFVAGREAEQGRVAA